MIVPSTPRYFTPAVKRSLNRSSFITLYFPSADERDKYYTYLNSSILYWWWRANDGGMTLSRATLMSLPVPPDMKVFPEMGASLLASENQNVVVKMNAGKANENVKHDLSLIKQLNSLYYPKFNEPLLKTHQNTVL